MRSTFVVVAMTLAAAAAHAQPQDPAAAPPGRLLEVDAVTIDRAGNPVTDLKPDEVEIWLERYRIPLESLTVVSQDDERRRRSIVLVLDDVTVRPDLVARAREAARRVVEQLEPGDGMSVVTLSGGGTKYTDNRAVLRQAVEAYNVRASMPMRPDDLAAHVFRTLASSARQVAETPGHRRTLIAIGSDWVFDSPVPPPTVSRDLRDEWTDAVRAMAFANAALYVIDPGGVGTTRAASGTAGLARETGGFAFLNTNDLRGAVDRIMREAVTYYIVRFQDPPFFRTAPLRKLDVRSRRDGVTVRARQLIPGSARPAPAKR